MLQRIFVIDASERHRIGFHRALAQEQRLELTFVDHDQLARDSLNDHDILLLDLGRCREADLCRISQVRAAIGELDVTLLVLIPSKPIRLRHRAIKLGADDYFLMPFHGLDLIVRLRAFLKSDINHQARFQPEAVNAVPTDVTVSSLQKLYRRFPPGLMMSSAQAGSLLAEIRQFCDAQLAMLFAVNAENGITLSVVDPEHPTLTQLKLSEKELPILEKAIRLQKPTVINRSSSDNPFTSYFNSMLNIAVRSFLIYPVVPIDTTKALLVVLKSDDNAFNEFHYLYAQSAAQLFYRPFLNGHVNGSPTPGANEAAFRAQLDFLSQVVDQLTFGILVVNNQLQINYVSEQAAELLQIDPDKVRYQHLHEILEKDIVVQMMSSVDGAPLSLDRPEKELDGPNGQKILVGFSAQQFSDKFTGEGGFIISMKDITYTKEIQEEMRRVDRLASLGVMASGIAHEIRNPLAGIKAMAQTFEEELAEDDPKNEYVKRIVRLVNRLDDLLRTLFSYAKPPKPDRRLFDMEASLRDVLSLLRQKIRENDVEVIESVEAGLPQVYVDPSQIQQVLINLILNSVEAIHGSGQVTINISLFDPAVHSEETRSTPQLTLIKPVPYIKIYIHDNGCGIPSENLDHIFNPFFTTKTFGTGLGLSIVYQIIKENEGIIFYESELDKGTSCSLYLPVKHSNSSFD